MSGTLVVAEHLRGEVRDVTFELVTAARQVGAPVTMAVVAKNPDPLAEAVDVEGVDEIVRVAVASEEFENDVWQQALEALIEAREPEVVILGFTVNAMGYAPAVAAKLGMGYASDVFALSIEPDGLVVRRAFYGAKVHGEVVFPGKDRTLLMLRAGAWESAQGPGAAALTDLSIDVAPARARHRDFVEIPAGDVDITTADFLLSIGRGIGAKETIPDFQELVERMGAILSSSRPLVDAGWMPAARQVGQSGKTVKPKVYLALGISGAVQHLAGIKGGGTVIAVNTDPEAAIFGIADYGAVADLFEVAEALKELY
jgi:electron transfer flavoprotein alpha subunit